MDAMYQEPGCGWKWEKQRTVWRMHYVRRRDVAGGRKDSGLYVGGSV